MERIIIWRYLGREYDYLRVREDVSYLFPEEQVEIYQCPCLDMETASLQMLPMIQP